MVLRIVLSILLLAAPFFPSRRERRTDGLWYGSYAVVGTSVIFAGLVYWFVWFQLLPRWRGYRVVEQAQLLDDGTSITRLTHIPVEGHRNP